MEELHESVPFEVGWSQNIRTPIADHEGNASTTSIFGFSNAITRLPKEKGGLGLTARPFSAALFPIWNDDEELARVGEILGSMLVGSYWFHGGYNSTYAGTLSLGDSKEINYDNAQREAVQRFTYCKVPDKLTLNAQRLAQRVHAFLAPPNVTESELEELKDKIRSVNEELKEKDKKLEGLREELADVTTKERAAEANYHQRRNAMENVLGSGKSFSDILRDATAASKSYAAVERVYRQRQRQPSITPPSLSDKEKELLEAMERRREERVKEEMERWSQRRSQRRSPKPHGDDSG
ncbi:MAG: hypothetical protein Q9226_007007 [Calogaya cf. arnoldii]